MEELERRESQGESWNLHSDKALLTALQELSSDIMASIGRLDSGLKSLEASTRTLTTRTGNASALFKDLCHSQFIEQVGTILIAIKKGICLPAWVLQQDILAVSCSESILSLVQSTPFK